jgi:hypothetical protein
MVPERLCERQGVVEHSEPQLRSDTAYKGMELRDLYVASGCRGLNATLPLAGELLINEPDIWFGLLLSAGREDGIRSDFAGQHSGQ